MNYGDYNNIFNNRDDFGKETTKSDPIKKLIQKSIEVSQKILDEIPANVSSNSLNNHNVEINIKFEEEVTKKFENRCLEINEKKASNVGIPILSIGSLKKISGIPLEIIQKDDLIRNKINVCEEDLSNPETKEPVPTVSDEMYCKVIDNFSAEEASFLELNIDDMSEEELYAALENPDLTEEQMDKIAERLDAIIINADEMSSKIEQAIADVFQEKLATNKELLEANIEEFEATKEELNTNIKKFKTKIEKSKVFKQKRDQSHTINDYFYQNLDEVQKLNEFFDVKEALLKNACSIDDHGILRQIDQNDPNYIEKIKNSVSFDQGILSIPKKYAHLYKKGDFIKKEINGVIKESKIEDIYVFTDTEYEKFVNALIFQNSLNKNEHNETSTKDLYKIKDAVSKNKDVDNEKEKLKAKYEVDKRGYYTENSQGTGISTTEIKGKWSKQIKKYKDLKEKILKKEISNQEIKKSEIKRNDFSVDIKKFEINHKPLHPGDIAPPIPQPKSLS